MPALPMTQHPDATASEWASLADRLRGCAAALVGRARRELADDLVQDALARLLARGPAPPPYPIARTTLVRLYLDHERSAARRARRAVRWALMRPRFAAAAAGPDEQAEQAHRVALAVEALPPKQRAALTLRAVEGLSYACIAEALGTTPHAARAALHEARARLRSALAGEEGGRRA